MELEIYQAETARIAAKQAANLEDARQILASGRPLSRLEFSGLQRALQVSIENAIGKSKRWLKERGQVVPISAYDSFSALSSLGLLPAGDLPAWNAIIGLRNRLVHDYMNIDEQLVQKLVMERREQLVLDFLFRDYPD